MPRRLRLVLLLLLLILLVLALLRLVLIDEVVQYEKRRKGKTMLECERAFPARIRADARENIFPDATPAAVGQRKRMMNEL